MIPSARPTVPPVAITILIWNLFCFARVWKVKHGRMCVKTIITNSTDCESFEWINKCKPWTRQESSKIHSASPQSRPSVIVAWFWSFGTDGRTTCVKIVITTCRDCGRPRGSIEFFCSRFFSGFSAFFIVFFFAHIWVKLHKKTQG